MYTNKFCIYTYKYSLYKYISIYKYISAQYKYIYIYTYMQINSYLSTHILCRYKNIVCIYAIIKKKHLLYIDKYSLYIYMQI